MTYAAVRSRIAPWLIEAAILTDMYVARGSRAGASIAALGSLRAEGSTMARNSDVAAAVAFAAAAALDLARRAEEIDVDEADELLGALLDADKKMSTATAYLRQRGRFARRNVSGRGEVYDRHRDSMDRLQMDRDELERDEGEEGDDYA